MTYSEAQGEVSSCLLYRVRVSARGRPGAGRSALQYTAVAGLAGGANDCQYIGAARLHWRWQPQKFTAAAVAVYEESLCR